MKQQPLSPSSALGSIITDKMTRRQARVALFKAGYKFVGGGSFASVWKAPEGTRVVKVTKPDGGSEATVRAAQRLPDNPHLPIIYGTLRPKNGGLVIETEPLLSDDGIAYGEFVDSDEWFNYGEGIETPLGEALRVLDDERRASYLDWDEHADNVMLRPRSDGEMDLVLTDLLYQHSALRNAASDAYDTNWGRKGSAQEFAATRAAANKKARPKAA